VNVENNRRERTSRRRFLAAAGAAVFSSGLPLRTAPAQPRDRFRRFNLSDPKATPALDSTACAMQGDRERCLEAGMDAYVAKPLRMPELLEVLGGLCSARGESEPAVCSAP
jgi:hypothetical protein